MTWKEWESAAEWCAERGVFSVSDTMLLPEGTSKLTRTLILMGYEAFERRVREYAYARAMGGDQGGDQEGKP